MQCLFVVKGGNTWKDLALQKLQRGSASSRDVGHISGASRLFRGSNRVTSSNDGDGTVLLGQISKDVNNSEGSLLEGLHFEDSHGSVHDDGFAVREEFLLLGGGGRTVVQSHPSIGDGIGGDNLGVCVSGEVIGDDNIRGKKDGLAIVLSLLEDLLSGLYEVILNKGGSNIKALGLEEGENHTSTNDDFVALVKKGIEDSDLGRDLGSTNNGGHGCLTVLDGSVKVFELLGEQEPRHGRLKELGHTLSGGVGAVGGTKGIVDEHVEGSGELLNESGLVLGLLAVETGVLKHDDISLRGGIDKGGNIIANAVSGELDLLSKKL
mmetsp:Transcript_21147/g.32070  ORF Transcript_21147/g.32070 Transcript_21147/m.32070 type:complete len:322 (-) Transcript_21147:496-1461(-)